MPPEDWRQLVCSRWAGCEGTSACNGRWCQHVLSTYPSRAGWPGMMCGGGGGGGGGGGVKAGVEDGKVGALASRTALLRRAHVCANAPARTLINTWRISHARSKKGSGHGTGPLASCPPSTPRRARRAAPAHRTSHMHARTHMRTTQPPPRVQGGAAQPHRDFVV